MAALTSCENTLQNFSSLYLVILFHFCDFELIISNPESGKLLLMESSIRGLRIQNYVQGIGIPQTIGIPNPSSTKKNPEFNPSNPESTA